MPQLASNPYKLNPFSEPFEVPAELLKRKQWIGWLAVWTRRDKRTGKVVQLPKPRKIPINIKTGQSEGYDTPEGQVSYEEALAAVGRLGLSGVGFMLMAGCGLGGGDIDGCRDPETGVIDAWVQAIIDLRETYFEVSPSGAGVRFWALIGELPLLLKKDDAGVELYSQGRYLTFTGQHIKGTPWEVRRAEKTIEAMRERAKAFAPSTASAAGQSASSSATPSSFEAKADRDAYHKTPMGKINQAALAKIMDWAPELFPQGAAQATGAWRAKAADLDRPFEEDISIHPDGIWDFAERQSKTAIDIVMDWSDPPLDATAAAEWLGARVGIPFDGQNTGSSGVSPEDLKALDDWNAALARLRKASPRPAFAVGAALDMPHGGQEFDPAHTGPMALRPGVTDRLTRGFVASVSSAANAGKSTYLGSEAVAIACERPDVLGLPSLDWCGNVLVVSNEEDANTLTSRWKGVMKAHGLSAGDFKHKITIWPTKERLRIGRGSRDHRVTPTPSGVGFVTWLAERAEAGEPVAVLGFDTLISIFEGVDENSADMDKAMTLLIQIAEAGFIAIDVMQHQGKASGTSETTLGYRGSSAIFAALAEMSTLAPLSAEEGVLFGLDAVRASQTIRLRGQRQRDGRIGGEWCFSREILGLPAEDPRAPGVLASKDVAILKPVVLVRVSTGASARDLGLGTLWAHQQAGGLVLRGQARGGRALADWAHSILGRAHGWTQGQAEAALVDWEREGVIETHETYPDGVHKQRTVEIIKPPNPPPAPF